MYLSLFHLQRWQPSAYGAGGGEGSAAAVKGRIAQKLGKTGVQAPAQLLNLMWSHHEAEIREVRGSPEEVSKGIMALAVQSATLWRNGRWCKAEDDAEQDQLYLRDPWKAGVEAGKKSYAAKVDDGKLDKLELRSAFINSKGEDIPRHTLSELMQAKAPWSAVICMNGHEVTAYITKVLELAGSIVLLSKVPFTTQNDQVALKKLQLVTRMTSTSEWRATQWWACFVSSEPIEVLLQGVTVQLKDSEMTNVIAELHERHVDQAAYMRFVKAKNLDYVGLDAAVFNPVRGWQWGSTPSRMARKSACIKKENLLGVLGCSGKAQISIRLELVPEEQQMGLAVHIVQGDDTEIIRQRLHELPHRGVVHLSKEKCLIRCDPKHLAQIRSCLSPGDARYALAPDVQLKRRWVVHDVPHHVSAIRLSSALLNTMGWKQLPIGEFKMNIKKKTHQVHIGAEHAPTSDTVVLEDHVCLIKEIGGQTEKAEIRPKVTAPDTSAPMQCEAPSSTGTNIAKTVQVEVEAARSALQGSVTSSIQDKQQELERRIWDKMDARMGLLEKKIEHADMVGKHVEELQRSTSETKAAVIQLEQGYREIEPMITKRVQEATAAATQSLSQTLEARFDTLGQQLMSSLASLAKKRESSPGDPSQKLPRGAGGGKRGLRLRTKPKRRRSVNPPVVPAEEEREREPEDLNAVPATVLDEPSQEESQLAVELVSSPKGRRSWKLWRTASSDIRELYWEFARVSKRGASKFRLLSYEGKLLHLGTKISEVDREHPILVVADPLPEHLMSALQGETDIPQADSSEQQEMQRDAWLCRLLQLEARVEMIEQNLAVQRHMQTDLANVTSRDSLGTVGPTALGHFSSKSVSRRGSKSPARAALGMGGEIGKARLFIFLRRLLRVILELLIGDPFLRLMALRALLRHLSAPLALLWEMVSVLPSKMTTAMTLLFRIL